MSDGCLLKLSYKVDDISRFKEERIIHLSMMLVKSGIPALDILFCIHG